MQFLHSCSIPDLRLSGQATGSKSRPHVGLAPVRICGSSICTHRPLLWAMYSERCAPFLARHRLAFSLYLALFFSRQAARYSLLALGGLLISLLVFGVVLTFAARVFIAVYIHVLAYRARPARFKMILHIRTPRSACNTIHTAASTSVPRRVQAAAYVGPYTANDRARF